MCVVSNASLTGDKQYLRIVRAAWGQPVTAGDWAAGDPSGDGTVGSADLDIVLAKTGAKPPRPPSRNRRGWLY